MATRLWIGILRPRPCESLGAWAWFVYIPRERLGRQRAVWVRAWLSEALGRA